VIQAAAAFVAFISALGRLFVPQRQSKSAVADFDINRAEVGQA
jgi:hypothetical protein